MVAPRKPSWDSVFPREFGTPDQPITYKIGSAVYLSCESGKPLGWLWAVGESVADADTELKRLLAAEGPGQRIIWCSLLVQCSPEGVVAIWPAFMHADCLRWYDGYVCIPDAADVLTAVQLQAYPETLPKHLPTPYEMLRQDDRVRPAADDETTNPHHLGG